MKILCVIGSMGVGGGAERVMSHLTSFLSHKHNVTWLSLYYCDGPMYPTEKEVTRINGLKQRNKLEAILQLRKFIKDNKPDIVLSFLTQINIATLLATLGMKTKVVVSDRGNLAVSNKLRKYLRLWLYPKAAGRVFQTNEARNYFSGKIKDDSIVIPNPIFIDPSVLVGNDGMRKKEIVSVGRLDYQKNHELTIRAFKNIADQYPDFRLLIYGDGSEKEQLQQLIDRLGLHDRVCLCGRQADVLSRIRDAQLFVMSSRWEGMPNALMEAMALGLPCISSDCPVGGPRELINNGRNGYLFENENQEQLQNLMCKVLSDLDSAETIGNNARDILSFYNTENICSIWEEYLIKCSKQ